MQRYWTSFAKTGDPNSRGLPNWPRFEVATRAYIELADNGPTAKAGLRQRACDLFMDNVKRLGAAK